MSIHAKVKLFDNNGYLNNFLFFLDQSYLNNLVRSTTFLESNCFPYFFFFFGEPDDNIKTFQRSTSGEVWTLP